MKNKAPPLLLKNKENSEKKGLKEGKDQEIIVGHGARQYIKDKKRTLLLSEGTLSFFLSLKVS